MPVPHNMEAFDSFSLANVVRYRQRRSGGGTVACSACVVNALCGFGVWECGRACDILHETLLEDMLKDPAYAVLHTNRARHCSLCVSHLTWVLVPCRDRLVAPSHKREALNPDTGEVAVINVTNPMVECNTIRAILAEVVSVSWW